MTSSDAASGSVAEILADINARLADLQARNASFTEINDRLHAENERLRRDETGKLLQPVIRDLIKLADNWRSRGRVLANRSGDAAQDMAKLCAELTDDVAMVLARLDVEEFAPGAGCIFDRHEHRGTEVRPTGVREMDGLVADTRRPGYRSNGRTIRFAEVVTWKYVASEDGGTGHPPADEREDAQDGDGQGDQ